jgi:hypothetical protein
VKNFKSFLKQNLVTFAGESCVGQDDVEDKVLK